MFRLVLLFLTVSGLQAVPIGAPGGLQRTSSTYQLLDGFDQGTEHTAIHLPLPDTFRQGTEPSGLVEEDTSEIDMKEAFIQPSGNGFGEMDRRHWLTEEIPDDVPVQRSGGGWLRVEEPSVLQLPDGFRQGTEPEMSIPDGFRQGTEPLKSIPDGFRQGTEPLKSIPDGFRQGTEPSTSRIQTSIVSCKGEVINGNCYEFNPTPMAFDEAQVLCRSVALNAELASVTNGDLHARLVSLVTNGGQNNPVLTWLGGMVKDQQAAWVDGSEWSYSDWMPGHPNIHTDKPFCLEMFRIDESWWTAADCELKRASICSYALTA